MNPKTPDQGQTPLFRAQGYVVESPPPAPPVQNFHHEPKVDKTREDSSTQPMDAERLNFTIV